MIATLLLATPALAGIDTGRAAALFAEAQAVSARDGGELWGVELYGSMLFLDPVTRTIVTNQPDPRGTLRAEGGVFVGAMPPTMGVANSAQPWQGVLWTTLVWPLPEDEVDRRQLLAHEMFHRVQPELGKESIASGPNAHLDTEQGRTWLRLEYRALERALRGDGDARRTSLEDALTFRALRQGLWPEAHAAEGVLPPRARKPKTWRRR